jgi:hypothetical protein
MRYTPRGERVGPRKHDGAFPDGAGLAPRRRSRSLVVATRALVVVSSRSQIWVVGDFRFDASAERNPRRR